MPSKLLGMVASGRPIVATAVEVHGGRQSCVEVWESSSHPIALKPLRARSSSLRPILTGCELDGARAISLTTCEKDTIVAA